MTHPPDWLLDLAYKQASSKDSAGDSEAAWFLLQILVSCLREEGDMTLTPRAREILAKMLSSIIEGIDPAKALFLEAKSGNPTWNNRPRDNQVVVEMSVRTSAGMKDAEAAREIANRQAYLDPKTGKPLSAKTINNIWCRYKKAPWPRATFSIRDTPD
jgi:hypothetical protein